MTRTDLGSKETQYVLTPTISAVRLTSGEDPAGRGRIKRASHDSTRVTFIPRARPIPFQATDRRSAQLSTVIGKQRTKKGVNK
ncbi:hypothetical protein BN973_00486 [Mycobacterium triplex]|uniref:Uncharacterized protein n=1 Tax=Mycobacterium triplex TaxID=47839 RepID=A0A024JQN6_9MYCO|nr:hypothetical protein BN973_00486 [Mycobacterium triplex]